MDSLTSVISHGSITVSRDINISFEILSTCWRERKKKTITSKDTNKSSFFQSKIFTVVKPNLFELITKDWVQHANEKINYAKHMVSKSLPQRRWQGLFKYLKKGFCPESLCYEKSYMLYVVEETTFAYFSKNPFGY